MLPDSNAGIGADFRSLAAAADEFGTHRRAVQAGAAEPDRLAHLRSELAHAALGFVQRTRLADVDDIRTEVLAESLYLYRCPWGDFGKLPPSVRGAYRHEATLHLQAMVAGAACPPEPALERELDTAGVS